MKQFYKGGFQSEMNRREASLILGKRLARATHLICFYSTYSPKKPSITPPIYFKLISAFSTNTLQVFGKVLLMKRSKKLTVAS